MTRAEVISGCGMPPMKPIIEQIMGQMHTEYENGVMRAVQSYGFNVDKDRLLQALTDAKVFYEEGYRAALREQEQREQGCEYCREDSEGYRKMLGSFSISNPFHKGEYYLNGGKLKPRKINFCPVCGRRLED